MHTLLILLAVFFGRHWLVAISNAALTALLGLGLVRGASRWSALGFSPIQLLRLRRFVLLTALYKGALYLLLGVSLRGIWQQSLIYGIQLPDPREILGLVPERPDSIWHPTAATKDVSLILLGIAFVFLSVRAVQLARYRQALNTLRCLGTEALPPRINTLLRKAAAALALPAHFRMPPLILTETGLPTPMLVGFHHPFLLLSPALAANLTDLELEMAFRHELVHVRQHDHWWRWLFTWLEDVGRLNLLAGRLGVIAVDLEEEICDRISVLSPQEALALATAIRKTVAFYDVAIPEGSHFLKMPSHVPDKASGSSAESRRSLILPTDRAKWSNLPSTGGDFTTFPVDTSGGAPFSTGTDSLGAFPHNASESLVSSESVVPGAGSAPARVIPALLGRHTRKWRQPSSLRERLESLLTLSQELSWVNTPTGPWPDIRSVPHRGLYVIILRIFRAGVRVGFGILLFVILYAKFYVAFTPIPFHH